MEDFIPLLIPVIATVGLVAIVIVMLVLRGQRARMLHQERLAAIEKGIEIPPELLSDSTPLTPNACLLRGLIWTLVGAAVAVFFVAMAASEGDAELYAASAIGLVPVGVGVAYLVCYRKLQREAGVKQDEAAARL
ncbi:MAG: hypothetical protein KIT09_27190 [Bryobacteraceae bacterium]|nr:hypothetical protein [Bryobacteraceae bacterium]